MAIKQTKQGKPGSEQHTGVDVGAPAGTRRRGGARGSHSRGRTPSGRDAGPRGANDAGAEDAEEDNPARR